MGDDDGGVVYPFLRRSLNSLPDLPPSLNARTDIRAPPYGWGGPWLIGAGDRDEMLSRFYSAFADWAAEAGIVSDYRTFCPMDGIEAHYPGAVEAKLPIVVRSLDLDDEALWRDYDRKVRKNVTRARNANLTVDFDEDGHGLQAFLDIYYQTMVRRGAEERYHFPRSFFEAIVAGLPGRFVFAHVRADDRIVSTELALVSGRCVYSFMGGTLAESFRLRPNDLLKHELIRWARSHGAQVFVLGGGVTSEDGIFRYKRSFAPSGTRHLQTGRWIIDGDAYERLVALRTLRTTRDSGSFFPVYRAP